LRYAGTSICSTTSSRASSSNGFSTYPPRADLPRDRLITRSREQRERRDRTGPRAEVLRELDAVHDGMCRRLGDLETLTAFCAGRIQAP
jgi:hypothetical protein